MLKTFYEQHVYHYKMITNKMKNVIRVSTIKIEASTIM